MGQQACLQSKLFQKWLPFLLSKLWWDLPCWGNHADLESQGEMSTLSEGL